MRITHFRILPLAFLLALSFAQPALATPPRNHALVMGGGCEEQERAEKGERNATSDGEATGRSKGRYNLFRSNFEVAQSSLNRNQWETQILYDGDYWERPWPGSKEISAKNLFGALRALQDPSKGLKKGDQLLLAIASHGSPRGNGGHAICLGNGHLLEVKALAPYIRALRSKGVKVTVVDDSCYSGATVDELASTGACVISSGNPNTENAGKALWSVLLGLGLPKGTDLNDLYGTTVPDVSADLDQDGNISAAEAFQVARLASYGKIIPRSSDCTLTEYALFQRINAAVEEDFSGEAARLFEAPVCRNDLTAHLEAKFSSMSEMKKFLISQRLAQLGYGKNYYNPYYWEKIAKFGGSPSLDIDVHLRNLRKNMNALNALVRDREEDQKRADAYVARGVEIPYDLYSKLRKSEPTLHAIKSTIYHEMRPLIQITCDEAHEEATPCETFNLFSSRGPAK